MKAKKMNKKRRVKWILEVVGRQFSSQPISGPVNNIQEVRGRMSIGRYTIANDNNT